MAWRITQQTKSQTDIYFRGLNSAGVVMAKFNGTSNYSRSYICDKCKVHFRWPASLVQHMDMEHRKQKVTNTDHPDAVAEPTNKQRTIQSSVAKPVNKRRKIKSSVTEQIYEQRKEPPDTDNVQSNNTLCNWDKPIDKQTTKGIDHSESDSVAEQTSTLKEGISHHKQTLAVAHPKKRKANLNQCKKSSILNIAKPRDSEKTKLAKVLKARDIFHKMKMTKAHENRRYRVEDHNVNEINYKTKTVTKVPTELDRLSKLSRTEKHMIESCKLDEHDFSEVKRPRDYNVFDESSQHFDTDKSEEAKQIFVKIQKMGESGPVFDNFKMINVNQEPVATRFEARVTDTVGAAKNVTVNQKICERFMIDNKAEIVDEHAAVRQDVGESITVNTNAESNIIDTNAESIDAHTTIKQEIDESLMINKDVETIDKYAPVKHEIEEVFKIDTNAKSIDIQTTIKQRVDDNRRITADPELIHNLVTIKQEIDDNNTIEITDGQAALKQDIDDSIMTSISSGSISNHATLEQVINENNVIDAGELINNQETNDIEFEIEEWHAFARHYQTFDKTNIAEIKQKAKNTNRLVASTPCVNSKTEDLLVSEENTHGDMLIFTVKCMICGKNFASEDGLKTHRLSHTQNAKPFRCTICSQNFGSISQLRYHSHTHSYDSRVFIIHMMCRICLRIVKFGTQLYRHTRIHDKHGKIDMVCLVCNEVILLESELKNHICIQSYSVTDTTGSLVKKISDTATSSIPFKDNSRKRLRCKVCSRFFKYKKALLNHVLRVHENTI